MGKQKTNKAVAKRFRLTRRGKLLYRKSGKQHLQSGKSPGRRRKARKWVRPDLKKIERKLATLLHG